MERITRRNLENAAEIIRKHGLDVSIDHHQPGDSKRPYAVETTSGARRWYGSRMTAQECMCFLEGMRAVLDHQEAGKTEASIWYKVEFSERGSNDWYACCSGKTHDNRALARAEITAMLTTPSNQRYDFRVVKVTQTEEAI